MRGVMGGAVGMTLLLAAGSSAGGAVIAMTVADASTGDYTLTSVSVTRGAAGTFTYVPGQLTAVELTDVDAFQTPLLIPRGATPPPPGGRRGLIEDLRIDTGVVNITRSSAAADRSMEVMFERPVLNSAGEDILFFEYGGDDGIRWWIDDDRENRGADVLSSSYSATLMPNVPFTLVGYNLDGDQDINDLAELESAAGFGTGVNASGNLRALGLDLSSVGVAQGESVTSIRLQSLLNEGLRVDPVLIVGLPAVPEPGGIAAMAGLMWMMQGRWRRR